MDSRNKIDSVDLAFGLEALGTSSFETLGERLRSSFDHAGPAEDLVRAIEGEVLPRLMLAHRTHDLITPSKTSDSGLVSDQLIEDFVDVLLHKGAGTAGKFVDELLAQGAPVETVFLELMAPTARRLGILWEQDKCDFTEVTIGLCRLHELLRRHSVVGDMDARSQSDASHSVLLGTACGDQHVFGMLLVAEFFRRDGWIVWSEPGAQNGELADLVSRRPVDLIGLSMSRSQNVDMVKSEIAALRTASVNKDLKVMLGGGAFAEQNELVHETGADAYASDATCAPQVAKSLLSHTRAYC